MTKYLIFYTKIKRYILQCVHEDMGLWRKLSKKRHFQYSYQLKWTKSQKKHYLYRKIANFIKISLKF